MERFTHQDEVTMGKKKFIILMLVMFLLGLLSGLWMSGVFGRDKGDNVEDDKGILVSDVGNDEGEVNE